MAEAFFDLSPDDKRAVLRIEESDAPAPFILEKDIWVVWTLGALFTSPVGGLLTFKGGTSLSKVFRVIDRFSEDVDITVDIRAFAGGSIPASGTMLPRTRSQADRWKAEIAQRLELWIGEHVVPAIEAASDRDRLPVDIRHHGDTLFLSAEFAAPSGGLSNEVRVEFGGRSTGEPHSEHTVTSDLSAWRPDLLLPQARPRVMHAERTFWEKATAVHVFCYRSRLKGERLARHWYDLVQMDKAGIAERAIADADLASAVAVHKSKFFRETTAGGHEIDYVGAVSGAITLVPAGRLRADVEADYVAMTDTQMFRTPPMPFEELMERCRGLEERINAAARARG
jgi:hypothetical protein